MGPSQRLSLPVHSFLFPAPCTKLTSNSYSNKWSIISWKPTIPMKIMKLCLIRKSGRSACMRRFHTWKNNTMHFLFSFGSCISMLILRRLMMCFISISSILKTKRTRKWRNLWKRQMLRLRTIHTMMSPPIFL